MLKTNTKKARENLMDYVIEYMSDEEVFTEDENKILQSNAKREVKFYICAKAIVDAFNTEFNYEIKNAYKRKETEYDIFKQWTSGLPLGGMFLYWYNRNATDDLAIILEETEEEKEKYTEEEATEKLTWLIYREINKAVGRR